MVMHVQDRGSAKPAPLAVTGTRVGDTVALDISGGGGVVSAYEAADFVADKTTSGTSQREAIPSGAIAVSVTNEDGTNAARFRFGDSSVVAEVDSGFRVLASVAGVVGRDVSVPARATHWAYIAEGGTPVINVVWGK